MAAPQAKREFGPEAAARRQRKAERAAQTRSVVADAMDIGRGGPEVHDTLASAEELATRRASAAIAQGRPLRGRESRAIRQQFRAERAGERPAGQPGGKRRRSVRERLEAMTPQERDAIELKAAGEPEVLAYTRRIRAEIEALEAEVEDESEYLLQRLHEQDVLAEIEDEEEFDWETLAPVEPEPVDEPDPWAGLTAEEQRAAMDIEATETYDFSEEGYE
jgi:hypothetical protein